MTSRLAISLTCVMAALGLVATIYAYGHQRGAASERQAVLTRSVNVLRERSRADEKVRNMDDAGICAALGGVFKDGSCQ